MAALLAVLQKSHTLHTVFMPSTVVQSPLDEPPVLFVVGACNVGLALHGGIPLVLVPAETGWLLW